MRTLLLLAILIVVSFGVWMSFDDASRAQAEKVINKAADSVRSDPYRIRCSKEGLILTGNASRIKPEELIRWQSFCEEARKCPTLSGLVD